MSVSGGELHASSQTCAKRQEKQSNGKDKRSEGRTREDWHVELCAGRDSAPIIGNQKRVLGGINGWSGHEKFGSAKRFTNISTAQMQEFAPEAQDLGSVLISISIFRFRRSSGGSHHARSGDAAKNQVNSLDDSERREQAFPIPNSDTRGILTKSRAWIPWQNWKTRIGKNMRGRD